jgi:hypothetical protein
MKIVTGLMLFMLVGAGAGVYAQQGQGGNAPKVIAEIAASSDRAVKGAPFSAEAISESVQTLADGNRIVRSWTSKLYRNSEGRFRREGSGPGAFAFGSTFMTEPAVTILDPAAGSRFILDPEAKSARAVTVYAPSGVTVAKADRVVTGEEARKLKAEIDAAHASGRKMAVIEGAEQEIRAATVVRQLATVDGLSGNGQSGVIALAPSAASKYEFRTENLGVQNIEGVDAEGTRTITTIPAGAIGNERPIEIVYERWFSKDLQVIVMSKHSDPRFGEQTYRLTNIVRSEPDPSLFEVPNGYTFQTEPGRTVFHSTAPGKAETRTVTVRAVKETSAKKPE